MQKHHKAWLAAHPERTAEWLAEQLDRGFEIHHIDGNHGNDDPDNLVLIERRDHMRLHGIRRLATKPDHMRAIGKLSGAARCTNLTQAQRTKIARKAAKALWAREDEKLSSLPRRTRAEIKRLRKKRRTIQRRYRAKLRQRKVMYDLVHSTVSATSANEDRAAEQTRGEAGQR